MIRKCFIFLSQKLFSFLRGTNCYPDLFGYVGKRLKVLYYLESGKIWVVVLES